jgi:2-hydroxychromene-2-carboxylate isomerase
MQDQAAIDWYFDFISPFSYFQFKALEHHLSQRPNLKIRFKPVLFAALLKHNSHKGPAEIPSKRLTTYRYCQWYANRHGIAFRLPAAHPFNPLPFLRLTIARECDAGVISQLFQYIWVESAEDPEFYSTTAISRVTGFEHTVDKIDDDSVKQKLRSFTDEAIARGVYGVPTIAIGEMLFWGLDMTDMALDYLDHPAKFSEEEYLRISALPIAQART